MKDEQTFLKKLIEVYVGGDLGDETGGSLRQMVMGDPILEKDLLEMEMTYEQLKGIPAPEFTEESYQRILMKVYTRGGEMQVQTPTPSHLQYHLPLQG